MILEAFNKNKKNKMILEGALGLLRQRGNEEMKPIILDIFCIGDISYKPGFHEPHQHYLKSVIFTH